MSTMVSFDQVVPPSLLVRVMPTDVAPSMNPAMRRLCALNAWMPYYKTAGTRARKGMLWQVCVCVCVCVCVEERERGGGGGLEFLACSLGCVMLWNYAALRQCPCTVPVVVCPGIKDAFPRPLDQCDYDSLFSNSPGARAHHSGHARFAP